MVAKYEKWQEQKRPLAISKEFLHQSLHPGVEEVGESTGALAPPQAE